MDALTLPLIYVRWHYTIALLDLWGILNNFLWFVWNFFSIPILWRSFFAPWKRMAEKYDKRGSWSDFFSALLINALMRAVGIVMRSAVLAFGLLAFVCTIVVGAITFLAWLLTPVILIILFGEGLRIILD